MRETGATAVLERERWRSLPSDEAGKRRLLSERVARQIERLVVDERLQPGDRLPAGRELTGRYGVSRTVVRDALAVLAQRGLVETRPGSGVFVRDGGSEAVAGVLGQMLRQDAISLTELMETRTLLEVHNAATAAEASATADLAAIAAALAAMDVARGARAFVEADVVFHEAVAQAAGNRVLAAFLRSLRVLLLQGMMIGASLDGARDAALREHTAIFDAIRTGQVATARRVMRAHLQRSYDEWVQAGHVERATLRFGEDDSIQAPTKGR
jgi:GntR family transcriptional repressor for pyruvate dehydrogenase complex